MRCFSDRAKAGAFAYIDPLSGGMAKNATGYSTLTESKGGTTWMLAEEIF